MAKGYKFYSDKQEKTIASYLGWKQIKGSGSRPFACGDISSDMWLGECKTHISCNHPIIFYFDVWDKIVDEASSQFKKPVLFVDDGSQKISNTLCLLDVSDVVDKYQLTNIDVYDQKSSIRYNDVDIINPKIFKRNNKFLSVMALEEFKTFIEIGD